PAAEVLPLGLQVHGAALLQAGEGLLEEVEPQDVALAGEQVVGDVDPPHGAEVAGDDPARHPAADLCARTGAGLQLVEGLAAQALALGVLGEPAAGLAVEVPAVEVERLGD